MSKWLSLSLLLLYRLLIFLPVRLGRHGCLLLSTQSSPTYWAQPTRDTIARSQSSSNRPNVAMGQQKRNTTQKQSTIFQRFGSTSTSRSAKPCMYAATCVHTPHATGCTCKRHLHNRDGLEGLSTNGLSGKRGVCKWMFSRRNREAFSCCNQGNFIPSKQPFFTQNCLVNSATICKYWCKQLCGWEHETVYTRKWHFGLPAWLKGCARGNGESGKSEAENPMHTHTESGKPREAATYITLHLRPLLLQLPREGERNRTLWSPPAKPQSRKYPFLHGNTVTEDKNPASCAAYSASALNFTFQHSHKRNHF